MDMNDIERYNFWHLEMDDFLKKRRAEEKAIIEFAERIGKPLDNLIANDADIVKKIKGA